MKRSLHESLDLAVVRALNGSELTVKEIDELRVLTVRDLMCDHDLDYVMANKVLDHVSTENLRMNAQNQYTHIEDYEDEETSATRTSPMTERRIRTRQDLRQLIKRITR